MRVPIPVVMFLALTVVGGLWWYYTRDMDFMTPPSGARLEAVRVKTESSFPRADEFDDTMAIPAAVERPAPSPLPMKPAPELGDLSQPPELGAYRDRASYAAADFIELAQALERQGEFPRAMLAWERVLDSTRPAPEEAAKAVAALARLRPTLPDWNTDPAAARRIVLAAGTARSLAGELGPVLAEVSGELQLASSGLIAVESKVTAGKNRRGGDSPTPVALWLTGTGEDAPSTEVLSFTVAAPADLRQEVLRTIFELVRNHLGKSARFTQPAPLAEGESPSEALALRVTRLQWNDFATALNSPPPAPE